MKDFEKTDLPVGWVKSDVNSVAAEILSGSGFPKEYQGELTGEYPFAKVGTISKAFRAGHKTMNSADNYISEDIRVKIKAKSFPKGTIVFPKIGEALKNNYRVITSREMIFDNNVMGIVPDSRCINGDYFYFFLTTKDFGEFAVATAVPSVRRGDVASISIPLPPLLEQRRIVTKIEELFSELDKGIENLKTAREQLKVYRQALLKHAFEGKLTEKWREENKCFDVVGARSVTRPGAIAINETNFTDDVTDKIKTAIKTAIKTDVKGGRVTDRAPTKRRKDLPPLTAEELAELPELPQGWGWVKLGQLTWSVKDGPHFSPKYVENGVPFISGGNIRADGVDFSKVKYISEELHAELCKRCKPDKGDILYTKGGTTGIARVNTYDIEFNVWVHVAVLKLFDSVKPFFVQHALNSPFCYSQSQKYTHGVGNQDLGLTRMINIILPTCSVSEQDEVIKLVDDKLSVIDNLDQTITNALQQSETLRQSILKKAFSGQLVPQDPHDEPAAVLLERIMAERDVPSISGKSGRSRKKQEITHD